VGSSVAFYSVRSYESQRRVVYKELSGVDDNEGDGADR
jgi:hypothetical protein